MMKVRYLTFRYNLSCRLHGLRSARSHIWLGKIMGYGLTRGLEEDIMVKKSTLFNIWFGKDENRCITIRNFKHIRKHNREMYKGMPDINLNRRWGIRTNGATRGNPKDTCLDWFLSLGHIEINYTNFNYNRRYRKAGKV